MRKVETYDALKKEKKHLAEKQLMLETEIKKDISELKQEVDQSRLFTKVVHRLGETKTQSYYTGIAILSDVFIHRVLFRKSKFLTRLVASTIARNITNAILSEKKSDILQLAKKIIQSFNARKINRKVIKAEKKIVRSL